MKYTKNDIDAIFHSIEESTIINYKFDLENKKIDFQLRLLYDGKISNHLLSIEKVFCVNFFDDVNDINNVWESGNRLELTSLWLDSINVNLNGNYKDFINSSSSSISICMEIWERLLIVKAKRIIIDDKIIDLL